MKPTMERITNQSAESKSLDITDTNIEQLKQIFPEVFSEGKVDFEALKDALGGSINDTEESYQLSWNGKNKTRQITRTVSNGTLRPCKEESVNWESTENLFIAVGEATYRAWLRLKEILSFVGECVLSQIRLMKN